MIWSTSQKTNIDMEKALWTGKNIYKPSICCFHVSFRGCIIEVGYFIVFLTQLKLQKLCCHRKFGTETGEGESERESSQGGGTFKIERLETWTWALFPKWCVFFHHVPAFKSNLRCLEDFAHWTVCLGWYIRLIAKGNSTTIDVIELQTRINVPSGFLLKSMITTKALEHLLLKHACKFNRQQPDAHWMNERSITANPDAFFLFERNCEAVWDADELA